MVPGLLAKVRPGLDNMDEAINLVLTDRLLQLVGHFIPLYVRWRWHDCSPPILSYEEKHFRVVFVLQEHLLRLLLQFLRKAPQADGFVVRVPIVEGRGHGGSVANQAGRGKAGPANGASILTPE